MSPSPSVPLLGVSSGLPELVVAVLGFIVAVWLYHRNRRLGPNFTNRGEAVEVLVMILVGWAGWQFVAEPLIRRQAPELWASGYTPGRTVITPLDHLLAAFVFLAWVGYMLVRPRLLPALGIEGVDDSGGERDEDDDGEQNGGEESERTDDDTPDPESSTPEPEGTGDPGPDGSTQPSPTDPEQTTLDDADWNPSGTEQS